MPYPICPTPAISVTSTKRNSPVSASRFLKSRLPGFQPDGGGDRSLPPWSSREPCTRSEEHTSELQSRRDLVCRLLLEKKKHKRSKKTRDQRIQVRNRRA